MGDWRIKNMTRLFLACLFVAALGVSICDADGSCTAPPSDAQAFTNKYDKFQLTYFDGRGLAEVPRMLLALSGRFPGAGFDDVRMTGDMFSQMKGSGSLAKNLNRAPVLNHNGDVIGQSSAISRYLANKLGFMGETDSAAAQIDAMCEHLIDLKAAYSKHFPYGKTLSAEERKSAEAIWFTTPSTPAFQGKHSRDHGERQLQWFLDQVETFLPGDGHTYGGRPSLADAYFYNMLAEHAPELGAKGEPFGNQAATDKVLAQYPKLSAVVQTFKSHPNIQHYLATRVKSGFLIE